MGRDCFFACSYAINLSGFYYSEKIWYDFCLWVKGLIWDLLYMLFTRWDNNFIKKVVCDIFSHFWYYKLIIYKFFSSHETKIWWIISSWQPTLWVLCIWSLIRYTQPSPKWKVHLICELRTFSLSWVVADFDVISQRLDSLKKLEYLLFVLKHIQNFVTKNVL